MISNKGTLDVSVVVCTLNEEKSIKDAIESAKQNNPKEIILVDGGSTDKTIEIASMYDNVKVIRSKIKGLAYQRQQGIDIASGEYTALIDADDKLDSNCLNQLIDEMNEFNFDAILARQYSLDNQSYWQRAHGALNIEITYANKPKETNMIGRPAVYRKKAIQYCGFDSFFNGVGNEDADISRRMEIAGFRQGIGTGVAYRNHSNTLTEVLMKFRKYGRGDAHFIYKYPEKRFEMIFHTLIRYPIIRGGKVIIRAKPQYFPYFLLCGWVRFFYLFITYIKLLVKQPTPGPIQDKYVGSDH